jgi:hypothetical protein
MSAGMVEIGRGDQRGRSGKWVQEPMRSERQLEEPIQTKESPSHGEGQRGKIKSTQINKLGNSARVGGSWGRGIRVRRSSGPEV